MGTLRCQGSRSGDILSFTYGDGWLKRPAAFTFDPDLALVTGPQYPAPDRTNFGMLLDSSPDRWGRILMQKRENLRARQQARKARSLTEWDFLLGVHDETRLGALRFQDPDSGRFIDSHNQFAAPPIASLRDLQAASLEFEIHADDEEHPEYQRWLAQLFTPGTSLGGAHVPKHPLETKTAPSGCELFPRVVFSILIHNVDDHLRNHGFFIGERSLTLSPAFDLNPSTERDELSLAINEVDSACDVSIALEAHADYGMSKTEAEEIVVRTTREVAKWRHEADKLRIPRRSRT